MIERENVSSHFTLPAGVMHLEDSREFGANRVFEPQKTTKVIGKRIHIPRDRCSWCFVSSGPLSLPSDSTAAAAAADQTKLGGKKTQRTRMIEREIFPCLPTTPAVV